MLIENLFLPIDFQHGSFYLNFLAEMTHQFLKQRTYSQTNYFFSTLAGKIELQKQGHSQSLIAEKRKPVLTGLQGASIKAQCTIII